MTAGKVAVYTSVTSQDQAKAGYSLEAQREQLRKYAKENNLEITKEFSDIASTSETNREPIAIVCDKVDRLQRGFKETPMIEDLRVSGKAQIHFLSDNLVIHKDSSSQDLMRYNLMVMMAQNYTDCISENVKRAHEQMVREGKAMGMAPVGYKNVRDENTKVADIVLDEIRAPLVQRLFKEYSTGLYSLSELVNMAKEWGLTNKRKPYKPLCKCQIEKMLKNVFYCGYAKRLDEYYQHYYPTIVSIELFMKCVEVRKGRNKQFSKMVKHETVFKGLIKCVNCGCTVTPDIKKGKYIYLKPNTKKIDGKKCDCKQINENKANDMVSKVFKSMTISEDVLQGYLQALKTRFDKTNNEEANERINLTRQLKFLDSRFDRLKKTYLDGDFSREEYLKEKQDIELEQKFLENKIAQLSTDNKEFEISLEYLLELTSKINFLYESSRIERKRKILNLVFSNFFLNGSNLSYELKKPFDLIVKKAYCLLNWA